MRVLITGASGFLGAHVTAALLAAGRLADRDGDPASIDRIVAVDVAPPRPEFAADPRVDGILGDASDAALLQRLFAERVDAVFALGATLTSDAEARFEHGYAVNLYGMLALLDACGRQPSPPRLVYTSSIAAFGGSLPATVDDDVERTPQTSYGTQKAIVELLVADYARRGFVDGRCLRLPIVMVRPAASTAPAASAIATASISDRLAGLVRERLAGRPAVCPWQPATRVAIASARAVAAALLALYDVAATKLPPARALNLPAVSVTVDELVAAVTLAAARHGLAPCGGVSWQPDAQAQAVVDGWPQRFVSTRAATLGIVGDASVDAIVDRYVEDFVDLGTQAMPR